jgi:hypothetical protein
MHLSTFTPYNTLPSFHPESAAIKMESVRAEPSANRVVATHCRHVCRDVLLQNKYCAYLHKSTSTSK